MSSGPNSTAQFVAQLTKILLSLWIAVVPCSPAGGANWLFTLKKNNIKIIKIEIL
jgi:hypothetical protein